MNALFFNIIITTRGERRIPIMAGAALIFNLGLNLLLIPRYQQVGSALITSLTELLLLCISILFVPKYLLPMGSLKVGGKVLIAALLMALVAFLLRSFSIFILIPVALLVYSAMAVLLRTVPREDVRTLYEAVRHKGEKSSTETLAKVVDVSIYTQVTQRLPANKIMEVQHLIGVELGMVEPEVVSEEDDITKRLPATKSRKVQSVVEPEVVSEEDDITKRLPATKSRKVQSEEEIVE